MAQNMQRLEDGLRAAMAQGNRDAATKIAQEIRNRRAKTGDQVPTPASAPAKAPEEAPDPFDGIPTKIGSVVLSDDIRQQMLEAKSLEDPKEKRLFAARLAGKISQQDTSGTLADSIKQSGFGAFISGAGAGLFGIGDVVASGVTAFKGKNDPDAMTFGEALEAQRAYRHGLEEEFPVTSLVGEIGGAVVGGGAVGAGVKSLAGANKISKFIKTAATVKKGQKFRNVGKVALAGAGAGAVTEGITEGEFLAGAGIGGLGGVLGAGIAKAAVGTVKIVKNMMSDPGTKGLKTLAKKIGISEPEMMQRFTEFKTVTGKNPAMADLINNDAAVELRAMIQSQGSAANIAQAEARNVAKTRGPEISEQLVGSRKVSTKLQEDVTRNAVAKKAFAAVENDPINFTGQEAADLLQDPNFQDAMSKPMRRAFNDALEGVAEDSPVTLSGGMVNDLRLLLRKRGRGSAGVDQVFNDLADELEGIARRESKGFGEAIDEFSERSLRGEGIEAGRLSASADVDQFAAQVKNPKGPAEGTVIRGQTVPGGSSFKGGMRVGARSKVKADASAGAQSANRLVNALTENGKLSQNLRKVLPAGEFNKLREVATLQARAGRNLETLAPGARAQADLGVKEAVDTAVGAMVLASGGAGAGFKAGVLVRIAKKFMPDTNPKVLENLAKDLFDPKRTKAALAALRRFGLEEDVILKFSTEIAAAGGAGLAATN